MDVARGESFFKFGILVKSFEAFQRIKAIILLLATFIISFAILIGSIAIATDMAYRGHSAIGKFVSIIGVILYLIIYLIGYTATGKVLMEHARNKASIPVMDAIIFGIFSFYRILISEIILAIVPLVVVIISLIYFFIAKIPGLGKLLDFIGIPGFTIIFAIMFFAILLINFMINPLVFDGNNLKEIIVKAYKIYKKHSTLLFGYFIFLMQVFVVLALIFILLTVCSFALTASILAVTRPTYLLSGGYGGSMLGMLNGGGGIMSSLSMFGGFVGFGVGIIYMLLMVLLFVYLMLGQNYIYLDVISDMNFDDVDAQFNDVTSKLKSNIEKYKEKAASMKGGTTTSQTTSGGDFTNNVPPQQAGLERQTNHGGSTGSSDAKTDAGVKFCTACGAQNPSDALFCENCGNKLS
ncbi:MAG: zinc-ribbon domain-containing protein [Candidatus Acidulodesulfobacterium acidiphilum]|uniref:Zinc-ribbon domain-containing protein n=1 Tax=Candidatus Acidulodesulfobacterium acidiphilum TaxID=2597224 RepID=A0A520X7Z3_9DELT|nr:MAG: zinc-ribbon domain-containing protein [Candidatus Acidulodesulfobacterium acidiphilum]